MNEELKEDALSFLAQIPTTDPEVAHTQVEACLLDCLDPDIKAAAEAVRKSCRWWGFA